MSLSRRSLLAGLPLPALLTVAATSASAETMVNRRAVVAPASGRRWLSGVTDNHPAAFGSWRGSPVPIMGMFGDVDARTQAEQWQFANSPSYTGSVDLAVGGPVDCSWAQAAAGAQDDLWKTMAAVLRSHWHYRTVFLRFAHEANGTWMPWSVAPEEVSAYRTAYRRFVGTMRSQLRGRDVKFVFAPNFGSWRYSADVMFPGADVVDVVGVSMYEWTLYDTAARWAAFAKSSIGPDHWLAFAKRHGKPMALSEWGGRSPYFIKAMHDWCAAHAGTGSGQLWYDVYMNDNELLLTGAAANQYRALRWGR